MHVPNTIKWEWAHFHMSYKSYDIRWPHWHKIQKTPNTIISVWFQCLMATQTHWSTSLVPLECPTNNHHNSMLLAMRDWYHLWAGCVLATTNPKNTPLLHTFVGWLLCMLVTKRWDIIMHHVVHNNHKQSYHREREKKHLVAILIDLRYVSMEWPC